MSPKKNNALVYCRVSVDDGVKKTSKSVLKQSIFTQESKGTDFCLHHGFDVIGVFKDSDVSGTLPPELRPGFREMIRHFDNADVLVVQDLSRLARSDKVAGQILDLVQDFNIDILGWKESIDIRSSEGEMFFRMMNAVNAHQVRKTRELSIMNRWEKAKRGELIVKPNQYGYKKDGKGVKIVESEAEVVRMMFKMALTKSASEIARYLHVNGYKTRKGKIWQHAGVIKILRNPMYISKLSYPKPPKKGSKVKADDGKHLSARRKGTDREFVMFDTPVPPLIEEPLFYAVQDVLESRSYKQNKHEAHLLTNCCHCGCCIANGRVKEYKSPRLPDEKGMLSCKLTYNTRNGKNHKDPKGAGVYSYYLCSYKVFRASRINNGWLHDNLDEKCDNTNIYACILEPAVLKICKHMALRARERKFRRFDYILEDTESHVLRRNIVAIENKMKSIRDKILDSPDDGDLYRDVYADLKRDLKKQNNLLADREATVTKASAELSGLRSIDEKWDELSSKLKNDALYDVCEIIAFKTGVLINFKELSEETARSPLFLPYQRRVFTYYTIKRARLGPTSQPSYRNYLVLPNEDSYLGLVRKAWKGDTSLRRYCDMKGILDEPAGKFDDLLAFHKVNYVKDIPLDINHTIAESIFVRVQGGWTQFFPHEF